MLIADDDLDTLELLQASLTNRGVEIVTATDGDQLLQQIAEQGPFDLIITDINMPWMEGLQVLASIRSAGLDTPVLVVTGLDRPDLAFKIRRLGNARLLRKPFEIVELRSTLIELFAGKQ
jgi:CheY-like chemotaxis protein